MNIHQPSSAGSDRHKSGIPRWIDTHAHLAELSYEALSACLLRARHKGVKLVVNSASSIDTLKIVTDQCAAQSMLLATTGVSPFDVLNLPIDWMDEVEASLCNPVVIGIGEIGLDNSNPRYPPVSDQIPVFEHQLAAAKKKGKPVLLHSRGAELEVLSMCKKEGITKAIFHCFTGSKSAHRAILDAGYCISFSGIVTFNEHVAKLAENTPINSLLVETDSPYLAPVPMRGKVNEPGNIGLTYDYISKIKNLDVEEFAYGIEQTFETLFGSILSHSRN